MRSPVRRRGPGWERGLALLLLSQLAVVGAAAAAPVADGGAAPQETLPRSGFHLHLATGWGAGPSSGGVFHALEVGGTLSRAPLTLGYAHVFVYSDGLTEGPSASDLFGGHFFFAKLRLWVPEVSAKAGLGLGENVDLVDGFRPRFGFGWYYGLELHVPVGRRTAITFGWTGLHAVTVDRGHQVAFVGSVGFSLF
ncbi:MAG: hypothetical protein IT371_21890 [Deltaproteobacteria bacterium]|nr:hypothetical protein [Deltaproteobacteria bacterium]